MKKAIRFICLSFILCCLFLSACSLNSLKIYKKFYECTVRFYVYPTFEEYDEGRYAGYEGYPDAELEKVAALLADEAFARTLAERTERQNTEAIVTQVKNSVRYEFEQYEREGTTDGTYRSTYLTVSVSVAEDEALCETLCDAIEVEVPVLVKEKLFVPMDYKGTACNKTERSDITTTMK